MARRSLQTGGQTLPSQQDQPLQTPPPVSLMGPPAEVPQPEPVELVIGQVPEPKAKEPRARPEVTVDEDGITTIN